MRFEIERKYLVVSNEWKENASRVRFCQGYVSASKESVVRVRIEGNDAFVTLKGKQQGLGRPEYTYAIPLKDAEEILASMVISPPVDKWRYYYPMNTFTWEIDEFLGENEGLIIAEIELPEEGATFPQPKWLGKEVTGDPRFYNSSLALHPFKQWPESERNKLLL